MSPRSASDGPAQQGSLTVKQQRAAAREAKLEKYRREQKKQKRNRVLGITIGSVLAAALVAILIFAIVSTMRPVATYEAGSEGNDVAGVERFENGAGHVQGEVDYAQTPPAGGEHNQVWLNCGVYTEPVPNENAVHSLEHGAVWITYRPDDVTDEQIETLRGLMPRTHAILSPFPDMDTPIAVSGWNVQLKLDELDEQKIRDFFEEFWQSQFVPEPGAACHGALDAPGKL